MAMLKRKLFTRRTQTVTKVLFCIRAPSEELREEHLEVGGGKATGGTEVLEEAAGLAVDTAPIDKAIILRELLGESSRLVRTTCIVKTQTSFRFHTRKPEMGN